MNQKEVVVPKDFSDFLFLFNYCLLHFVLIKLFNAIYLSIFYNILNLLANDKENVGILGIRLIIQENIVLTQIISEIGPDDWTAISTALKLKCETANMNKRSGKQCRERWFNHLCPDFEKTTWTR